MCPYFRGEEAEGDKPCYTMPVFTEWAHDETDVALGSLGEATTGHVGGLGHFGHAAVGVDDVGPNHHRRWRGSPCGCWGSCSR